MIAFDALLVTVLAMVALAIFASVLRPALVQALRWGGTLGACALVLGMGASVVMDPGANQGPLLGVFVTGPLGFLVGAAAGFLRALHPAA